MQNSIYKIKYLLFLSWDWEAWFLTVWGVIPPPLERNTAWNKGRKCFRCLGAPNNVIRPWSTDSLSSKLLLSARQNLLTKRCPLTGERVLLHCFGAHSLLKRVVSMVTAVQSCKHPPCKMIFVSVNAMKVYRWRWCIDPLVVNFTFRPFYPSTTCVVAQLILMLWRKEKSVGSVGIRTPIFQPVA